jgi:Uma2 family endonuclease
MSAVVALRALDLLRLPDEERTKLGVVGGEGGFVFGYNPDTVLAPDIVFVVMDRLPPPDQEGFINVVSNLVVQVLSRSETAAKRDEKVPGCLAAGVQLV